MPIFPKNKHNGHQKIKNIGKSAIIFFAEKNKYRAFQNKNGRFFLKINALIYRPTLDGASDYSSVI
jgi:hypothetical protein